MIEGKSKTIETAAIMTFKDDVTAGNKEKHAVLEGKGDICCAISAILFKELEKKGIDTHFKDKCGYNQMLVKPLGMIPIEFVVRNISAGSFHRATGIPNGFRLSEPIVEYYLKADELGDPLLNFARIKLMNLLSMQDLSFLTNKCYLINDILLKIFSSTDFTLVDYKLEFGRDEEGDYVLGDEISPDSMRLWRGGFSYDKDIFRSGSDRDLIEAYKEVLAAL